jgi:phage terminase large subunit GpA-like protein
LPDVTVLSKELEGYLDVLMGRVTPPIEAGELTLMEIADAYYSRASEIQMQIMAMERDGGTFKGSVYYKFRTGELRTFLELTKRAADLGSRRLTQARLEFDMEAQAEGLGWSQ